MRIELKTEIPGPRSRALMEQRRAAVARGPFHGTPIFVAKAHGAVIEDVDGNRLLDFASGIAVANLGHTPEDVVRAVQTQAERFLHTSFNVVPYEGYVALCERLNRITPGAFAKKAFLANSGAEAVENAVKIARAHTKRQGVVVFDHAFHGRTFLAMTMTSKVGYRQGFAPFVPEVYRTPFPYAYRSPEPDASAWAMRELSELVLHHVGANNVAAVVIELVLGEGGFIDAPVAFVKELASFCKQHGIVLIVDEIQTGFGRTGKLFACEHYGIEPDLVTLAKGLGSGLPISAVVGRAEIMDAPIEGAIGGTFGGNPVACAAALAVIDRFEADGGALLKRIHAVGETIGARLLAWKERFPIIGDVRGIGPMRAIELVKDPHTREPDKASAQALAKYCYQHGVVVLGAGTYGNVIRLAPPLTLEDTELDEGLVVLEAGLAELGRSA
ncbi:4-aminobutyrate--2-oxoglutarate transaminase [Polyangium jinanense]|uniref:4-aminobutyrate--2-oxoglutarate transaminase n=1 Tax=Polyangium jinanense TaxID=2829994 RepID=A0A9X4AR73_9BACT|nr:4-aminobutyrate--2-oxoglutarate transaminase [Polyangium jinanense]MDC3955074.1 4-aminobutyrate--2-oxoglutarate transaminase [Polyangium jinanense]MDC3981156.1 4-aminobutyrate--2-oxoglutarate transaminase [Polyangium jinanense]